jgi:hypothetical protein
VTCRVRTYRPALRRAARERGGPLPSIAVADALLYECLRAHGFRFSLGGVHTQLVGSGRIGRVRARTPPPYRSGGVLALQWALPLVSVPSGTRPRGRYRTLQRDPDPNQGPSVTDAELTVVRIGQLLGARYFTYLARVCVCAVQVVPPTGFEPAAFCWRTQLVSAVFLQSSIPSR